MDKPNPPREFWQKLADVQPFGIELTAEQVQSWFDTKWPTYSERGYTQHRRAIANWWNRVYEDEIHRAIERLDRIEERTKIRRLEDRLPQPIPNEEIPDFFLKVVNND